MKKILITLTLTLFAASSYAQSSSVIVGSGQSDSSLGKSDKIVERSKKDLEIIKQQSENWKGVINTANSELGDIESDLQDIIQELSSKNEVYMTSEEDEKVRKFTTKYVPTCYGEKPRLIYKSEGGWTCVEAIKCSDLNSEQDDWVQEHDRKSGESKCTKPRAVWTETEAWDGCSAGKEEEERTLKCTSESDTTKEYNNDACVQPKPIEKRRCATSS